MTALEEARAYLETMPEAMYGFHAQTLIRALIAEREAVCTWREEEEGLYWATECGEAFAIIEGSPSENDLRYCCFCGKRLAEAK